MGARMALPSQEATSVGVFGGDPVVGRALEQLLRSVGYAARFLTEASLDKPGGFDGLQILLLAGETDAGRRGAPEDALESLRLPILRLVAPPEGPAEEDGFLPWPCRVEELRERIEAALSGGPRPFREGEQP